MADTDETMNVRKSGNGVCVIEIEGDITAGSEKTLMDAYNRASDGETKVVILDFTKLAYMNSSGIGLLVTLLIRANRNKQSLMAVGLNDHYQQIFQLTRLDEAIGIYGTEEEALAAVG